MRHRPALILVLSLLLLLCACGQHANSETRDAFLRQSTLSAGIDCTLSLDVTSGGVTQREVNQTMTGEMQVDLGTMASHFSGTLRTDLPSGAQESAMECFGSQAGDGTPLSYFRVGDTCYYEPNQPYLLSFVALPGQLAQEQLTKRDGTERISGQVCDVYTGSLFPDEPAQLFVSGLSPTGISLDGALMDVTLWVECSSALPVRMTMHYANLDEIPVSFSGQDGSVFTLHTLDYTIDYRTYGTAVDTAVPEEIIAQAVPLELLEETWAEDIEPTLSDEGNYLLRVPTSDVSCEIQAPEHMLLDEQTADQIRFYYFYDEQDWETICYSLLSGVTAQEEAGYAASLSTIYAGTEGASDIKDKGIQSLSLDGRTVSYQVVTLTLERDGVRYATRDVFSWQMLGERDVLEVELLEYSVSGKFTDLEDELAYAWAAVVEP